MPLILNVANPAAGAGQTGPLFQLVTGGAESFAYGISAQLALAYVSGGAAANLNVWLQTSLDGGQTWCDVISFTQLAQASARVVAAVSAFPPSAGLAPAAASDGALAAGSVVNGLFGGWWRVKYSVGTAYTGGTVLSVAAFASRLVPAGVNAFN
jgi:hypothetical protein